MNTGNTLLPEKAILPAPRAAVVRLRTTTTLTVPMVPSMPLGRQRVQNPMDMNGYCITAMATTTAMGIGTTRTRIAGNGALISVRNRYPEQATTIMALSWHKTGGVGVNTSVVTKPKKLVIPIRPHRIIFTALLGVVPMVRLDQALITESTALLLR